MQRLLVLALCFFALRTSAQNGSIDGKVVDDKGVSIPYATVILEGTQNGASTNDDGSYEINNIAPGSYMIKVCYVGYSDFKQPVTVSDGKQPFNITMKTDYQSLNEVEVVGYQTEKRSHIN